ncbi:MAG: Unknown protein [uncultured Sulfurovum sp.]|uniref:Sulfatase-modifying factor enzyme-like domain-containing protein n=1 Tax=uncultured Sulfurovum sp. TaxID=269237 RepID=A0A6S6TPS0_9BACT|nr:MAG: Unknown protein [uncultured Sulfurovum sp.]
MLEELEKLIKELDKGDANRDTFDDLVIVEILWLAHSSDEFQKAKKEKSPSDFLKWLAEWIESIKKLLKNVSPNSVVDEDTSRKGTSEHFIYSENKASLSLNTDSSNKEKIRIPKKKEYYISNELIEALAPLQKPFLSINESQEVDEVATVDYVARTNIVNPIFKAKNENYYDLYLLIDISKSMFIWEETIQVFLEKLKIYSYFRNIKVFYIDTQDMDAPIYTTKRKTHKVNLNVSNSDGHALMFVVSDFIAPAWRKGNLLFKVFERNEKLPTSLINMLPRRMWNGTILANANFSKIHNPKKNLKSTFVTSDIDDEYDEVLYKLPIVNFSLEDFNDLSHFIIGSKANLCTALVSSKEEILYEEEHKKVDLTAEERVQRFFENSSYEAHELALYFSITTHLNFDIMKMIQHNMLPNSQQIHLAEVFVGGLIDKSSNEIFYKFITDKNNFSVRDILLDRLGDYKAMATLKKNSEFIAQNLGSSLDFMALLHGDFNKSEWSKEDEAFAEIARSVFDKIGGNYSKVASKISIQIPEEEIDVVDQVIYVTPTSKRFTMGSNEREEEQPIHEVIINYDFEIAQTPVTVGEFRAFVEDDKYITEAEKGDGAFVYNGKDWEKKEDASWKNPYFEQTDEHPVVCISWNDAQAYIKWLNKKTGEIYRLPTEAEWEYACRAGSTTKWHFGDDEKELEKYAWYRKNSDNRTHSVSTRKPNQWGLYDMNGNVWEWCQDDYTTGYKGIFTDESIYEKEENQIKVFRGGSWADMYRDTRSAGRGSRSLEDCSHFSGFRLLRTLP